MPLELNTATRSLRCDVCNAIIKTKPIVVKTCCNNRPWTFCSNRCYTIWMRDWLRKQEQTRQKGKL
ncbi:hypothetical protein HA72_2220 [Metallosphaera sedula]|uniref:TRASH transcription regulator C-terminal archaeal domain-containing protein n=3 Tax=Metallosphaera TaxID=41980 RepID=A4YIV6_METS5|nr:hypothetical protein Msed_2220 [Metallosphaera sedula DSM 5348]AIM28341.1 hypothetical protein HA72_2220 [Metallosphaera sedula]QCO30286.1 hypothetical protein DFR88_07120 [Metallosphaera prunae]